MMILWVKDLSEKVIRLKSIVIFWDRFFIHYSVDVQMVRYGISGDLYIAIRHIWRDRDGELDSLDGPLGETSNL